MIASHFSKSVITEPSKIGHIVTKLEFSKLLFLNNKVTSYSVGGNQGDGGALAPQIFKKIG